MSSDLVTLVNEQDEVVGELDKVQAHRYPLALHRAISVFLFRRSSAAEVEVLIQQRSPDKITAKLQWGNTCCGNVWPGETYLECAKRRLRDELGITAVELIEQAVFRYEVRCDAEFGENEIDHVFAGWFDGQIQPVAGEVAATKWVKWSELLRATTKLPSLTLVPWLPLLLQDQEVVAALNTFVHQSESEQDE